METTATPIVTPPPVPVPPVAPAEEAKAPNPKATTSTASVPAIPAADASTASETNAAADTDGATDDGAAEPTADEVAAARIVRISRDRKALRDEKSKVKEDLTLAETHRKVVAQMKSGDITAALEAAGLDADAVYNQLTDQILARGKKPPADPAKAAEEIARKVVKDTEAERANEINERVKSKWVGDANATLDIAKHPILVHAIAAGRITHEAIYRVAEFEYVNGRDSDAATVLAYVEAQITPPKPKVTPAPTVKATPTPAAATGSSPVKPPVVEDDSKLTIEEVLAKAKAKYIKN